MQLISESLEKAIEELAKLPGMGRKSAQRIAMHLLKQSEAHVDELALALSNLKKSVVYCSVCCLVTDRDPCPICSNPKRENGSVCVVEDTKDVYAIEKTGEFRGRFHVLGGVISPLDNIGPNEIRVKELVARVSGASQTGEEQINEVILALNPSAEGEATSFYLHKLLKPFEVKITRIAQGIPMGTELEFIDEITLSKALNDRSDF